MQFESKSQGLFGVVCLEEKKVYHGHKIRGVDQDPSRERIQAVSEEFPQNWKGHFNWGQDYRLGLTIKETKDDKGGLKLNLV